MPTKSPIALVKERFKDKAGLVAAVKDLTTDELWNGGRLNEGKGLDHVSNKKLLHLHDVLSSLKKEHGSRAKLIDVLVGLHKRDKDKDYRSRLESKSTPALVQIWAASKKRDKASAS